jgi:GxxExxY protein
MLNRGDIIYPDLSYKIVGCAFEVYNALGGGLLESQYQRAMAKEFELRGLKFREQVHYPVEYKGVSIGKGFMDFLIEDKIVVELKRGEHFSRNHINQVNAYLLHSGCQLGLLIQFAKDEVRVKRILNLRK